MYVNKVILFGNITKDPQVKALPSGSSVCSFSIATNRTWKNKDGEKQESTDYHNIVAFGRTAENIAQYLRKGSSLYIEGRLQTRSYEKDDQKRYVTEVVADHVQFGPKKASAERRDDEEVDVGAAPDSEALDPEDIPF